MNAQQQKILEQALYGNGGLTEHLKAYSNEDVASIRSAWPDMVIKAFLNADPGKKMEPSVLDRFKTMADDVADEGFVEALKESLRQFYLEMADSAVMESDVDEDRSEPSEFQAAPPGFPPVFPPYQRRNSLSSQPKEFDKPSTASQLFPDIDGVLSGQTTHTNSTASMSMVDPLEDSIDAPHQSRRPSVVKGRLDSIVAQRREEPDLSMQLNSDEEEEMPPANEFDDLLASAISPEFYIKAVTYWSRLKGKPFEMVADYLSNVNHMLACIGEPHMLSSLIEDYQNNGLLDDLHLAQLKDALIETPLIIYEAAVRAKSQGYTAYSEPLMRYAASLLMPLLGSKHQELLTSFFDDEGDIEDVLTTISNRSLDAPEIADRAIRILFSAYQYKYFPEEQVVVPQLLMDAEKASMVIDGLYGIDGVAASVDRDGSFQDWSESLSSVLSEFHLENLRGIFDRTRAKETFYYDLSFYLITTVSFGDDHEAHVAFITEMLDKTIDQHIAQTAIVEQAIDPQTGNKAPLKLSWLIQGGMDLLKTMSGVLFEMQEQGGIPTEQPLGSVLNKIKALLANLYRNFGVEDEQYLGQWRQALDDNRVDTLKALFLSVPTLMPSYTHSNFYNMMSLDAQVGQVPFWQQPKLMEVLATIPRTIEECQELFKNYKEVVVELAEAEGVVFQPPMPEPSTSAEVAPSPTTVGLTYFDRIQDFLWEEDGLLASLLKVSAEQNTARRWLEFMNQRLTTSDAASFGADVLLFHIKTRLLDFVKASSKTKLSSSAVEDLQTDLLGLIAGHYRIPPESSELATVKQAAILHAQKWVDSHKAELAVMVLASPQSTRTPGTINSRPRYLNSSERPAEPLTDDSASWPDLDLIYAVDNSNPTPYLTQPPRSLASRAQLYKEDGDYDIVLYAHKPKVKAEELSDCRGVGRRKNTTFITPFGLFQLDQSGERYTLMARGDTLRQYATLAPYVARAEGYQDAPHSIKAELNAANDPKGRAFLDTLDPLIDSAFGRKPWVSSRFYQRETEMRRQSPFKNMRLRASPDLDRVARRLDFDTPPKKASKISAFHAFTMLSQRLWRDAVIVLTQAQLEMLKNPIEGWASISLDDDYVRGVVTAYNEAVSLAVSGSEVSHELRSLSRQLFVLLPQIMATQAGKPVDPAAMLAVLENVINSPFLDKLDSSDEADPIWLRYQALCRLIQKAFPFEAIAALIYGENGLADHVQPYAGVEVSQKYEALRGLIRDYLQPFATAEMDAWLRENQTSMATDPARALRSLNQKLRGLAELSTDSAQQQAFFEALETGAAHRQWLEAEPDIEPNYTISTALIDHLIASIQQLESELEGLEAGQAQAILRAQSEQPGSALHQLESAFGQLPFGYSSVLRDAVEVDGFDSAQAIDELKTCLWNIPYDVDIHNMLYPDEVLAIEGASTFYSRHEAFSTRLTEADFHKAADGIEGRFVKIGLDARWYFTQIAEALYGVDGAIERRVSPPSEGNLKRAKNRLLEAIHLFEKAVAKLGLELGVIEELHEKLEVICWGEAEDLLHALHGLHPWLAQQFSRSANEQTQLAAVLDRGLLQLEAEPLAPYERAAMAHQTVVVNAATFVETMQQIEAAALSGNINLLREHLNAWIPGVRLFDIVFPAEEQVEPATLIHRAIDVLLAMPAYIDLYASQNKIDAYRFCDRAFKPLNRTDMVSLLDQALAEAKPQDPRWYALHDSDLTYGQAIRDHLSPDIVRALGQEFVAQSLQNERTFQSQMEEMHHRYEAQFQEMAEALEETKNLHASVPAATTEHLLSSTCGEDYIPLDQTHSYHHLGCALSERAKLWHEAQTGAAQEMAAELHRLPTGGIVDVCVGPENHSVTMDTEHAAKVQAFITPDMVGLRASMKLNFPEGCGSIEDRKRHIKHTCQALAKTSALAFYTAHQAACTHEGVLDEAAFGEQLKQNLLINAQSSKEHLVSKTDHYYARCLYSALRKLGFTHVHLEDNRPSVAAAHTIDSVKTSHHDERLPMGGQSMRSQAVNSPPHSEHEHVMTE